MKLDVSKLPYSKKITINDNIVFDKNRFICHRPLVDVLSCTVKAEAERFEEFIYVNLSVTAKVILECSYSLQHFETTLKGTDEIKFSSSIEDENDDEFIVYKGLVIDLDEYVFNLLSASVPVSPKAPKAKLPESNKGYRILSDVQLAKDKGEVGNSKFDSLKDLEF